MFHRPFISRVSLLIPVLLGAAMPAHAQRPASWFVPNVVEQFNALTERADPLGISHRRLAESEHVQALSGAGAPRRSRRDAVPDRHAQRQHTRRSRVRMIRSATIRPARRGTATSSSSAWDRGIPHGERFRSNRQTKGPRHRRDAARSARSRRHLVQVPGRHRLPALRPSRRNADRPVTCSRSPSSTPTMSGLPEDGRADHQYEGSDQP